MRSSKVVFVFALGAGTLACGASMSAPPAPPAPAIAAAPPPELPAEIAIDEPAFDRDLRARIESLADEMTRAPDSSGLPGAARLYAHAFAGYALVDAGLAFPGDASKLAERLDRLVDRVLQPVTSQPFDAGKVSIEGRPLSASVALRGHLALMLVGRSAMGALAPEIESLLRALVRGISNDIEASPLHLLPTYGKRVWPADNEVAAAALALYLARFDRDPAVARGLASLQRSLASIEGDRLPPSAIASTTLKGTDVPRGCALSWTVAMRGLYDPSRAHTLYVRYKRDFFVDVGPIKGFREWPRGVDRAADDDSGPIIAGVGVAASGIGIGAARLAGESEDADALITSAELVGLSRIEGATGDRFLERAMAAWARSARPWK